MSYRICFGGIHIESTTFTSYVSSKSDFRIKQGEELMEYYSPLLIDASVTPIPLIMARAIPGGEVSREFFDEWMNTYLSMLEKEIKQEPIDGILLDIHGAMSVVGLEDAEGYLASKIRELVGKKVIITATMDLHGNVSDKLFTVCDLLTCYRTAPHIDVVETKQRALDTMIKVLDEELNIYKAKVDVPILLPGEKTSTEAEPGKSLYNSLEVICENNSIFDASIWMGFPWADQARCHSAIVVTGTDRDVVNEEALELAKYYWSLREKFTFVGPVAPMNEAVTEAINSKLKPFFISDTGDNPGAGGANDINILLNEFLNRKISKKVLFSSIYDKESTDELYKHNIGDIVEIQLGGKVDPVYGEPLKLTGTVKRFFANEIAGNSAVISIDNIDVIVTEKRFQYGTLKAYNNAGVMSFDEYDIIVVKMGYLEPDLSEAAEGWVMALTNGAVSQDLANIDYKKLSCPIYPLDKFKFEPKLTK